MSTEICWLCSEPLSADQRPVRLGPGIYHPVCKSKRLRAEYDPDYWIVADQLLG